MMVDVIYKQSNGAETVLGVRKLSHMPPAGEPFEMDRRQYVCTSYAGPDATGRYRLFLEDRPVSAGH